VSHPAAASWLRARDVEIGEPREMHARRAPHLRQEHRAELAGADQADADRASGGFALGQLGEKIHGYGLPVFLSSSSL
jgi:hypothetical protein